MRTKIWTNTTHRGPSRGHREPRIPIGRPMASLTVSASSHTTATAEGAPIGTPFYRADGLKLLPGGREKGPLNRRREGQRRSTTYHLHCAPANTTNFVCHFKPDAATTLPTPLPGHPSSSPADQAPASQNIIPSPGGPSLSLVLLGWFNINYVTDNGQDAVEEDEAIPGATLEDRGSSVEPRRRKFPPFWNKCQNQSSVTPPKFLAKLHSVSLIIQTGHKLPIVARIHSLIFNFSEEICGCKKFF